MDAMKRKKLIGIVTLIVGVALGPAIGVSGVRTSHASSAPASNTTSATTSPVQNDTPEASPARTEERDSFRPLEQMQAEIDRAIRHASEQFELGNNASMFRPDLGYS